MLYVRQGTKEPNTLDGGQSDWGEGRGAWWLSLWAAECQNPRPELRVRSQPRSLSLHLDPPLGAWVSHFKTHEVIEGIKKKSDRRHSTRVFLLYRSFKRVEGSEGHSLPAEQPL